MLERHFIELQENMPQRYFLVGCTCSDKKITIIKKNYQKITIQLLFRPQKGGWGEGILCNLCQKDVDLIIYYIVY